MKASRLAGNLERVRGGIAEAARRAGRDPAGVRIVAVTKGQPFSAVEAALEVGLRDLAENRMGALEERMRRVPAGRCRWHMVGHLQTRKAPRVHEGVDLLHSLDSGKLARRLDRTAPEGGEPLRVLVQVNTSGEAAKGGFAPDGLEDEVGRVLELSSLRVEGLMTMAPFTDDERVLRSTFAGLRELRDRLEGALAGFRGRELSMGMSNDFELAVEEGSTMVRLGTVLFGERGG
jgi:PLP dependent protein